MRCFSGTYTEFVSQIASNLRGNPEEAEEGVIEDDTLEGKVMDAIVCAIFDMVGEMVQNSQSSYSFTFNAVIVIHEYIYLHSTTKFTFKKYNYSFTFNNVFLIHEYIYSHLRDIFIHIQRVIVIYIFIQHFLCTAFAHH